MTDEHEIVKLLKSEEKLGKLQSPMQSNRKESQSISKDLIDDKTNQKNSYVKNDDQRKTEHTTLNNLETIYQTIFENSAVAITVTDENERIIFWNKYAETLLGMNKEDVYMKSVESLYPPDEWKNIRSQNIRKKGMQHHLETKILRKNNAPLDVDISLSVLKDSKGKIIGSIGIVKDISEQKQAEQRLTSLMEYANDSIYLVDQEGRYILINNELLSRLGLSKGRVIGRTFSEFHSQEETTGFIEKIKLVFKNGKPVTDEHRSERLDRWFLRTLSPVKDNGTGKIKAVAVVSKDITDWKKTEKMLKVSEEKYRTIFENSAIAIMLTDENEKIVSWNKYTEKLLGMKKEELYMKPVASLYPSDEWKKIRSQNIRQKGMQHRLETKILKKNNEILDVDISLSVLKDHDGNIVGSVGAIKDISEQKMAEEERQRRTEELDAMNRLSIAINTELKSTQQQLKELNEGLEHKVEERTSEIKELLRQKDEFIGQLGHDLKTPLSILTNMLPMIKEDVDKPELKKDCDMAIRNVDYIENLVTETLKIAELSSLNVQFNIQDIKLLDVADNVIKNNQLIFENENIKIKNMIDEKIIVTADELRLSEMFNNLISNAIKYSDDGGTITIDAQNDEESITITVKDTGVGMNSDQLEHIFDEFYKADNSRHNLGSSGLGLSICKRIVEKHGGKIWAESPGVGKGTTFYFTLRNNNKN